MGPERIWASLDRATIYMSGAHRVTAQDRQPSEAAMQHGDWHEYALADLLTAAEARVAALEAENETLTAALERIVQWADAYPLDVFHEPTREEWQQVDAVLKQAGLSLGAVSGSNMRHVVQGVGGIARAALAVPDPAALTDAPKETSDAG
jgi:hypothetical protein